MIDLLNLFKKSKPIQSNPVSSDLRKPSAYYDINGKRYAINDSMDIKVQSSSSDVNVFGWALEVRSKDPKGEWYGWWTYWNNRIYNSRQSALSAAIQVSTSYKDQYEYRIAPLYRMNEPQWRDYQIDQLLFDNPYKEKKYEIKAWRVIEDYEETFKNNNKVKVSKGTIYIQMENGNIVRAATTSERTGYGLGYLLRNYLLPKAKMEEIDIRNEEWIHPHLCKELKTKLKQI